MSNSNSNAVLRRKATVGREAYQARAMSPAKALRLALSKAADELFDLPLVVTGVQQARIGLDPLLGELSDETLLIMLDGPDSSLGVLTVDIQLLAGLIEMQTTARVIPMVADARPPTRTDAAMVAPLVDAFMARLEDNLADEPDGYWVKGFRFGVRVEDVRMLGLALEAPDYNIFRLSVDLFGGAKMGEIALALPERPAPRYGSEDQPDAAMMGVTLTNTLMNVPTDIRAVLRRITMPLSSIGQLKVGDVLTLPREALSSTSLEATPKKMLAEVSLGQLNGFRAVRLNRAVGAAPLAKSRAADDDFTSDLENNTLAGLPDLPDLGGLPDLPDLPDLPSLPDLPDIDGGDLVGALPDLPDLPELSDLPSLPDLPDLPDLDAGTESGDIITVDDLPDIGAMPMIDLPPLES